MFEVIASVYILFFLFLNNDTQDSIKRKRYSDSTWFKEHTLHIRHNLATLANQRISISSICELVLKGHNWAGKYRFILLTMINNNNSFIFIYIRPK